MKLKLLFKIIITNVNTDDDIIIIKLIYKIKLYLLKTKWNKLKKKIVNE